MPGIIFWNYCRSASGITDPPRHLIAVNVFFTAGGPCSIAPSKFCFCLRSPHNTPQPSQYPTGLGEVGLQRGFCLGLYDQTANTETEGRDH